MVENDEIILLGSISKIDENQFKMNLANYLNGKLVKKAILNAKNCCFGKKMLRGNTSDSVLLIKIRSYEHQDTLLKPKTFEVVGLINGDGDFIS